MNTTVGIPVFLLSENRLFRDALARILNKKSDITVVGTAAYSPDVSRAVASVSARVLLFDPGNEGAGLAVLRAIRQSLPGLKIIMIGMDLDVGLFLQAVRGGIAGYLLRDATAADVEAAVRAAANDLAVCHSQLCKALFDYVAQQFTRSPNFFIKQQFGLTRREQQLVELVGRGLTNKEIAGTLCLSEQTVKNHVHRVLRKLGVRDRLAAVEVCRTEAFSIPQ